MNLNLLLLTLWKTRAIPWMLAGGIIGSLVPIALVALALAWLRTARRGMPATA